MIFIQKEIPNTPNLEIFLNVKRMYNWYYMYAIIYFNWSGSIEDFKKAEEIMKRTANKFDNLEWKE